jgi:hypothetical protein
MQYVEEREGGYYVAGARISLDSIVHAFQEGESPEAILKAFPMAGPESTAQSPFTSKTKEKVEAYLLDQERLWREVEDLGTDHPGSLARLREAKEHTYSKQS